MINLFVFIGFFSMFAHETIKTLFIMNAKDLFFRYLDQFDPAFDFIFEYALNNVDYDLNEYLDSTNPSNYVASAFLWKHTLQTFDYWQRFNAKWLFVLSLWQKQTGKACGHRRLRRR